MAGSSQSSFIPKNTNKRQQRSGRRRIYVFSYVSYTVFFGTLLAAVGVFLYTSVLTGELETQKQQLAREQSAFSDDDMLLVREFEHRLMQAENRFTAHVPVSGILTALSRVVADGVRFNQFSLTRPSAGDTVAISLIAESTTLDALRFQREAFGNSNVTDGVQVSQLKIGTPVQTDGESENEALATYRVSFEVRPGDVPYVSPATTVTETSTEVPATATSTDATDDTVSTDDQTPVTDADPVEVLETGSE